MQHLSRILCSKLLLFGFLFFSLPSSIFLARICRIRSKNTWNDHKMKISATLKNTNFISYTNANHATTFFVHVVSIDSVCVVHLLVNASSLYCSFMYQDAHSTTSENFMHSSDTDMLECISAIHTYSCTVEYLV